MVGGIAHDLVTVRKNGRDGTNHPTWNVYGSGFSTVQVAFWAGEHKQHSSLPQVTLSCSEVAVSSLNMFYDYEIIISESSWHFRKHSNEWCY